MVTALVLAGLAAFLLVPAPARVTRLATRPAKVTAPRRRRWWLLPGAFVGPTLAFALGGAAWCTAVCAITAIAATTVLLGYRSAQRRAARRRAADVLGGCLVLAAEVRAGRHFAAALTVAAADFALLGPVRAAVDAGGDATEALRLAGAAPGAGGLIDLARAWRLSEGAGASLAPALDTIVGTLRARSELATTVAAELAAPRATGRLLGVLPLAGVLLGALLGVDPLGFLTGSPVGRLVGLSGVLLACAGLLWSDHLATDRERR